MIIAFQGERGAYSDLACQNMFPEAKTYPCDTFEDAFYEAEKGQATHAMIPTDNTLAGRVADVHRLLPESGLSIIGEHYLKIDHCLMGINGTTLEDIKEVHSHVHAIPQCRQIIEKHGWKKIVCSDTAGSAKDVAELNDKSVAAIASSLAAEIYGLEVIQSDVQDEDHNTTRFILLARNFEPMAHLLNCKTSFFFRVRNVPAALYKALGCFAVNGLQFTKLESYVDPDFNTALFFAEIRGHTEDLSVKNAFDELKNYTKMIKISGCYESEL